MRRHKRVHRKRAGGFALPLAVMLLVAVSLIAALLFDAALGHLRTGAAELGQARAESAAETALAAALAVRLDTSTASLAPGALLVSSVSPGPGAASTFVHKLASPFARVVIRAQFAGGHLRVSAGRVAIVVLAADSAVPGELRMRPAGGPWLVAVP